MNRIRRRAGMGIGVGFVLGAILGVVVGMPWGYVVALGIFGLVAGGFMAVILSVSDADADHDPIDPDD